VQTAHPLNGVLVVDKPGRGDSLPPVERRQRTEQSNEPRPARLPTSHDVVDWVRRWSGQRRIGHTGTLDPMASATRLVEYYQGETKSYAAGVTLGSATDTYDAEGQTVATAPVPPLAAEAIRTALARFTGEIRQRPPVYSAIKQGGENLYEKARRGESVEAPERTVTIHQLRLETWQPPDRINLWVDCSAGTYVRSLAVDLAVALGTVGHLAALRRERVGEFTLAHAHSWQQIQEAARWAQGCRCHNSPSTTIRRAPWALAKGSRCRWPPAARNRWPWPAGTAHVRASSAALARRNPAPGCGEPKSGSIENAPARLAQWILCELLVTSGRRTKPHPPSSPSATSTVYTAAIRPCCAGCSTTPTGSATALAAPSPPVSSPSIPTH
jgi:tRNA pseudouridine55 synthase